MDGWTHSRTHEAAHERTHARTDTPAAERESVRRIRVPEHCSERPTEQKICPGEMGRKTSPGMPPFSFLPFIPVFWGARNLAPLLPRLTALRILRLETTLGASSNAAYYLLVAGYVFIRFSAQAQLASPVSMHWSLEQTNRIA